ncbi:ATPase [Bacillus sp. LL01]|uniref:hypothetical protein n=1 Tax=Bacillus sp. LL01 TaxID=1665556 RepID=UPI00064CDE8A|nr:hypothetical protein [Bacillus sp. LL01]KMJ57217.1 ATPase [Bacillus sp. LL01]
MGKSFWIPLSIAFGSMILLYLIGFFADIDFLIFKWSPSSTEIALLPIVVGLLLGYISERIIKHRNKSNNI